MNNKQIKADIKYIVEKEGKSMRWLSQQLGFKDQSNLSAIFRNKSITIEKLNWILKPLGYEVKEIKFGKEGE